MKNTVSKLSFFLLLALTACGSGGADMENENQKNDATTESGSLHHKGPDYEMINGCLRTTLSYKLQVEPRDYDSLATYYFHEIRDYANLETREKAKELKNLRQCLKDSVEFVSKERLTQLESQIDILQQEINADFKDIIGYVFVHSFILKEKDTMSAIFVMDDKCSFKELIKVKAITDPNPDDYIESIRAIQK